MTNRGWASGCLFALCTIGLAHSQTPVSGVHVFEAPASGLNMSLAGISGGRCGSTVALAGAAAGISLVPHECSHCVNAGERGRLAWRFVDATLGMWRQRLNLEHWEISVVMARRSDLTPKTTGKIRWDKDKKTAVIWVMDASEYQLPFRKMLDDMEFTIVHELVHLELASLPRSEASRGREEYAVNRIAAALLRLARQQ